MANLIVATLWVEPESTFYHYSLMVKTLETAETLMTDPQVNLKLNVQRIELELEINPIYASVDAFCEVHRSRAANSVICNSSADDRCNTNNNDEGEGIAAEGCERIRKR